MKEEMTLCARLEMVAALVPQGARLIDIGTDHAYLPAALFKRGRIASAWAADVREGPLERARGTLARAGLSAQIGLKRSDGLDGFSAEGRRLQIFYPVRRGQKRAWRLFCSHSR